MLRRHTVQVILESDSGISSRNQEVFLYMEWFFTFLFSLEYLLRLFVTKNPVRYAKSFFGWVDIFAILPTYINFIFPGAQYLMVIRVFRLLRIFRILKLVRFTKAASILSQALSASRYKVMVFLGVIMSLVLILGTCMYIVEGDQDGFSSILKSMYWAIVTMTTVGYGDVVPISSIGKLIASIMMLLGYAIIAVPTGIVTSELMEAQKQEQNRGPCSRCKTPLLDDANYCHKCATSVM
jgi:voltage-gated potassium channel